MSARTQLDRLGELLSSMRAGELGAAAFSDEARSLSELRHGLPTRFDEVLLSLLDRLEAGALFTEESCSFSVKDLHESLSLWLVKAQAQLAKD